MASFIVGDSPFAGAVECITDFLSEFPCINGSSLTPIFSIFIYSIFISFCWVESCRGKFAFLSRPEEPWLDGPILLAALALPDAPYDAFPA